MSKKMKCPPKMDKKKPIKPVKAWAILTQEGKIDASTATKSKDIAANMVFEDEHEKVIRVEIRAI